MLRIPACLDRWNGGSFIVSLALGALSSSPGTAAVFCVCMPYCVQLTCVGYVCTGLYTSGKDNFEFLSVLQESCPFYFCKIYLILCVRMSCLFIWTTYVSGAQSPKRVLDPMKLELRIVKPSSSARTAALTLSHLSSPIVLCRETGSLSDLGLTDEARSSGQGVLGVRLSPTPQFQLLPHTRFWGFTQVLTLCCKGLTRTLTFLLPLQSCLSWTVM